MTIEELLTAMIGDDPESLGDVNPYDLTSHNEDWSLRDALVLAAESTAGDTPKHEHLVRAASGPTGWQAVGNAIHLLGYASGHDTAAGKYGDGETRIHCGVIIQLMLELIAADVSPEAVAVLEGVR